MPAISKNLKQLNISILFMYVYHVSVYDIFAVFLNVGQQLQYWSKQKDMNVYIVW